MDLNVRTAAPATPVTSPRETAEAPGGRPAGNPPPGDGKPLPVDAGPAPAAASVAEALARIQDYLRQTRRELEFQVDAGSGRTVIRVIHPESGALIRQIPSEEVLQVAAAIEAGNPRLLDRQA